MAVQSVQHHKFMADILWINVVIKLFIGKTQAFLLTVTPVTMTQYRLKIVSYSDTPLRL